VGIVNGQLPCNYKGAASKGKSHKNFYHVQIINQYPLENKGGGQFLFVYFFILFRFRGSDLCNGFPASDKLKKKIRPQITRITINTDLYDE
jgi:hypothetical protein